MRRWCYKTGVNVSETWKGECLKSQNSNLEVGLTAADAGISEGTQWGQFWECWETLPNPTGSNCCWNQLLLSRWKLLAGMTQNSKKNKQVSAMSWLPVFSSSFYLSSLTVYKLAKEKGNFQRPNSSFIRTNAYMRDGFEAERQDLNSLSKCQLWDTSQLLSWFLFSVISASKFS